MSDYQDPPVPPDPRRVARQALVLASLTCRSAIDDGGDETRHVDEELRAWLAELDLLPTMHESERSLLDTPFGQLSDELRIEATWSSEGLAVLAWALGRSDLPLHDELVNGFDTCTLVDFLSDEARDFIERATLRSSEELHAYREVMYRVDCRFAELRHHSGEARDIRPQFDPAWWETLRTPPPFAADGDLAIEGVSLREAPAARRDALHWAIGHRHRASIWLVGDYATYALTPADT